MTNHPHVHSAAEDAHHAHDHDAGHGHTHGVIDPSLLANERGVRALKVSLVGLLVTALFQVVVVYYSGSVGLLAETLHNFGDAFTAVPLWIAFSLSRRPPARRFTYGLGRVEDLAGLVIVLIRAGGRASSAPSWPATRPFSACSTHSPSPSSAR